MPRVVIAVVTFAASCLLAVVPSGAQADEPVVRADGESITYVDPALEDAPTVTVEGTLLQVVVEPGAHGVEEHEHGHDDHGVAEHDDGRVEHVVVTDDGTSVPVALDLGAEQTISEVPVEADLVAGPDLESALEGEATGPVEVAAATIATESTTTTAPVTAHRAYVAVVTNSGAATLPASSTVDARVDTALSWWTTESGGAISSFTRPAAQVRYASTLADRCGMTGGAGTTGLWNEAAAKFPGVSFSSAGNHLIVVVDDGCPGGGIATVGRSLASGGTTTVSEDSRTFTSTLVHELGHNVGLLHANYKVAGGTGASAEYWNLYSPMGLAVTSTDVFGPPALDSIYRAQLQILGPGEVEEVPTGAARTVSLAPRGASSGTRAVRVVADGRTYWIDLRDGSSRDATSFYSRRPTASIGGIRYPHAVTVTDVEPSSPGGTRLLAPTSTIAGWGAGQTIAVGSLSVRVDAISGGAATVTVANGAVAPTPSDPVPIDPGSTDPQPIVAGEPSITGTPRVGQALTAVPGTWTDGATFTYAWLADGQVVGGATSRTFVPGAAQAGRRISVRVTGTRPGYVAATRSSTSTAPVAPGVLASSVPRISGTPKVGVRLTAVPGSWTSGTTLGYQWLANGVQVSGARASTFTPAAAQRGKRITVRVTGRRDGYSSVTRASASSSTVAAGTLRGATPRISGTPRVGRTLRASPGTWTSGTSLRYRWYANGKAISRATRSTYTPTRGTRGKRITVKVTATKSGYTSLTRTSARTGIVR